jgi:hypothetical protein
MDWCRGRSELDCQLVACAVIDQATTYLVSHLYDSYSAMQKKWQIVRVEDDG